MNTRIRAILIGWLGVVVLAGRVAAQEPFPGLDAYVNKAMADWKVPGLSVAVVRNDSVLYTKGYGILKIGTTAAVDERTLFEIGSSSKSFTATLVAMLVTDGKMRCAISSSQVVPAAFAAASPAARNIMF